MKWNPYPETKPTEDGWHLVWIQDGKYRWHENAKYCQEDDYWTFEDAYASHEDHITHWMKIEPPTP